MNEILKYFPELTALQREQFAALGPLYAEWNARINVISRREMASGEFYTRHVLHSLAIARVCRFESDTCAAGRGSEVAGHGAGSPNSTQTAGIGTVGGRAAAPVRVMDIGTGGGFPAVPLAIMFPEVSFTAVDSIAKKIRVVDEVARAVGLGNLTAVCGRAEAQRGPFDYVVSRAVAPARELVGWARPRRGFLLLKGGDLTAELAETARPYEEFRIADWFTEEFFETKKVIRIP